MGIWLSIGCCILVVAAAAQAAQDAGRRDALDRIATAGEGGVEYATWFEVKNVEPVPFSKENPLRSIRPVNAR
jgi:hypothetical protein